MTYPEKLARLAYWAAWVMILAAVGWLGSRLLSHAPVDPRTGTPGLAVETDAGTGCDYVVTPWGGIFARLDTDGKPMCRAKTP